MDQEVQTVRFHLSNLVAQYYQASPAVLEDQVIQEGLDLPEIKQQLVWGLWHMW